MNNPNVSPEQGGQSPSELPPDNIIKLLECYRRENAHEWTLLSNRVTSYITSQSFLVTAFAIAMGNQNTDYSTNFTLWFPLILTLVGGLASVLAYQGITGAILIIGCWNRMRDELFEKNPSMKDFHINRPLSQRKNKIISNIITCLIPDIDKSADEIHRESLRFAIVAPWLFGLMWVSLAVLVLVLHYGLMWVSLAVLVLVCGLLPLCRWIWTG